MASCLECKFYFQGGQCRRFPPQHYIVSGGSPKIQARVGFPSVRVYDWCGEFKVTGIEDQEGKA